MKRIGVLVVILIGAILTSLVHVGDVGVAAEKPKAAQYSNSFSWEITLDTSADSTFDTTFSTSGGAHAMLFTGIDPYSSVSGYISFAVTLLDTNAGGEYIDTSKDSLGVAFYTDWGDTTYKKLVYKINNIKPTTSAATNYFSIPIDSVLGTRIWPKFTAAVADSDYTVARASCGVTYTATINVIAKP